MFELTLPYPNYFPTKPSQPAIYRQVSFPVTLNLDPPERPVLFWQLETFGASVPKAAINEYRHLVLSKGEVGPAKNRQVPPPSPQPLCPHHARKPELSPHIPLAPDLGHNFRTFFFGPDVSHRFMWQLEQLLGRYFLF